MKILKNISKEELDSISKKAKIVVLDKQEQVINAQQLNSISGALTGMQTSFYQMRAYSRNIAKIEYTKIKRAQEAAHEYAQEHRSAGDAQKVQPSKGTRELARSIDNLRNKIRELTDNVEKMSLGGGASGLGLIDLLDQPWLRKLGRGLGRSAVRFGRFATGVGGASAAGAAAVTGSIIYGFDRLMKNTNVQARKEQEAGTAQFGLTGNGLDGFYINGKGPYKFNQLPEYYQNVASGYGANSRGGAAEKARQYVQTHNPDGSLKKNAKVQGRRAMGGRVQKGKAYIVGEKGPELFVPGESGIITPKNNDGTKELKNMATTAEKAIKRSARYNKMASLQEGYVKPSKTTTSFIDSITNIFSAIWNRIGRWWENFKKRLRDLNPFKRRPKPTAEPVPPGTPGAPGEPGSPQYGMPGTPGTPGTPSTIPPGIAGIMALITKGESGRSYNAMNQGTAGRANDQSKIVGSRVRVEDVVKLYGKPLTSMTVGEIKYYQSLPPSNKKYLFAAGFFQMIPDTLKTAQRLAGVKDSDLFDQATQDKMGQTLVYRRIGSYLKGTGTLEGAMLGMAQEWAGLPSIANNGRSWHRPHLPVRVTLQELEAALVNMKTGKPVQVPAAQPPRASAPVQGPAPVKGKGGNDSDRAYSRVYVTGDSIGFGLAQANQGRITKSGGNAGFYYKMVKGKSVLSNYFNVGGDAPKAVLGHVGTLIATEGANLRGAIVIISTGASNCASFTVHYGSKRVLNPGSPGQFRQIAAQIQALKRAGVGRIVLVGTYSGDSIPFKASQKYFPGASTYVVHLQRVNDIIASYADPNGNVDYTGPLENYGASGDGVHPGGSAYKAIYDAAVTRRYRNTGGTPRRTADASELINKANPFQNPGGVNYGSGSNDQSIVSGAPQFAQLGNASDAMALQNFFDDNMPMILPVPIPIPTSSGVNRVAAITGGGVVTPPPTIDTYSSVSKWQLITGQTG